MANNENIHKTIRLETYQKSISLNDILRIARNKASNKTKTATI